MDISTVQRPVRRLIGAVRQRIGVPGIAGAVLLALAAVALMSVPRMSNDAETLHADAERTRARLTQIDREITAEPGSALHMERFRAWLPPAARSTTDLRTLFSVADDNRIALPKADYALKKDEARRISRIDIVLPIVGNYREIRAFVAATLDALPNASLADLRMERGAASTDRLEVRLRLTLFYRES